METIFWFRYLDMETVFHLLFYLSVIDRQQLLRYQSFFEIMTEQIPGL